MRDKRDLGRGPESSGKNKLIIALAPHIYRKPCITPLSTTRAGFIVSSEALPLTNISGIFSVRYQRGILPPSAFPSRGLSAMSSRPNGSGLRFPPLITHEKAAPSDSAAFDKPFDLTQGHERIEWLRPRARPGELST
jgi:hypothetical protein